VLLADAVIMLLHITPLVSKWDKVRSYSVDMWMNTSAAIKWHLQIFDEADDEVVEVW